MLAWDSAATAIRTSINDGTVEGRQLVSKCLFAADIKIRKAAGDAHPIVGFFAHGALLETEVPGELVPKIRLVLIREDGKTISTWSDTCVRSFAYIARKLGPGPWAPPVLIWIEEFPLGEGKSYCNLCEVASPGEKHAKRKGRVQDSE